MYEELREYHRERNKRLGYGDDTEEWSELEYRKQRQKLKRHNTRAAREMQKRGYSSE